MESGIVKNEKWETIENIYHAAAEVHENERAEFLKRACRGDEALRKEIESLLLYEQHRSSFERKAPYSTWGQRTAANGDQTPVVGDTILHYRIIDKIGAGGMGVVYKAEDLRLKRFVALKFLLSDLTRDEFAKQRFMQEAQAASALDHANICTIHEIDETSEGQLLLVMACYDGETLKQRIERGPLAFAEALDIAIQISQGLARAHESGIVHRDIKPANVMLTSRGEVKILDFGLAELTGRTKITRTGMTLGTVAYMSPEQARGEEAAASSDVWAFGVMFYEMLTGRLPFEGEHECVFLNAIEHNQVKPIAELREGIPEEIERIVGRSLQKSREARYASGVDLMKDLIAYKTALSTSTVVLPSRPGALQRLKTLAAAAGAVFVLALGVTSLLDKQAEPPGLVRLTSDSGLTMTPALSADGRLLAYASDRSGEGNLDIWVQEVAASEAVRLTQGPADANAPAFSPDGRSIAFRSENEGGGIYEVSTLGGESHVVASFGRRPRFSPDGKWIAYWIGSETASSRSRFIYPKGAKIYIVPAAGGPAQQLRPDFAAAGYPIWAPDSQHVLFLGTRDPEFQESTTDWWVTSIDGRSVIGTGAGAAFRGLGISVSQAPETWTADGGAVIMSAQLADTWNLWRVPISTRDWRVSGAPRRLTSGTIMDVQPSIAGNALVFASLHGSLDIWSLPLDARQASTTGSLKRLTEDAFVHDQPVVSSDGTKLAFGSVRSGKTEIRVKDLGTGKETVVSNRLEQVANPNFSPDHSRLLFRAYEKPVWNAYLVSLNDARSERLCEGCTDYGWSSDGKRVLLVGTGSVRVSILDLASQQRTPLLHDPAYLLFNPRFAPDDRWVLFNATNPGWSRIFVAPVRNSLVPESEWIPITEGPWDDQPRWSPDGNTVYFVSERDGYRCVWAQRLDTRKHPAGPAVPIFHAHEARRSMATVGIGDLGLSVARDKIVFNLSERNGNLWMVNLRNSR
jgi:serine/threonine protein kinase